MTPEKLQSPHRAASAARTSLLVIASVVVSTLVRFALNPILGERFAFITYFPALVFSAWVGGWSGGLAALALSTLAATYYFITPTHVLQITDHIDQVSLFIFFIVGLSVSAISSSQRQARQQAEQAAVQAQQSELALRESEARYRLLLETANEGLLILDTEDRITYANARLAEMVGCESDALPGRSLDDLLFPEDVAEAQERRAQRRPGRQEQYEMRLRHRDGTEVWTLANVTVLREAGEYTGTFRLLTDITQRKAAEARLAAQFEKERRIAEALQRSLLQKPPTQVLSAVEVETFYEPAFQEADVGGDYFDVLALEGNRVALVVGDVSGKGLEAASRTVEIKFTLRAYLREFPGAAVALNRLNFFLCDSQALDEPLSSFFVCVTICVLDTVTGKIEVAVGGMEPPLILRSTGVIEEALASGMPLGCFPTADYTSITADLGSGDAVLIATDGITEARQGDKFLENNGLIRLAQRALAQKTLKRLGQAIVEGARTFGGGRLNDDVCLLLARRR